jgi:DNA-binding transcriptional regulator YiaG
MATFAKVWQEEVRRLARKEIKLSVTKAQKDVATLRRTIAQLRRRIEKLDRDKTRIERRTLKLGGASPAVAPSETDGARVSSGMIRRLRDRLGLTQAELAKLLDVSPQSVYQWESKQGRLRLRSATLKAVVDVRRIGVREARRRLEAMR